MLAKGMQILLHPADILTAIRHEHHLLILLHPLRLHQLPQSPSRFLVVGLNEPETLRRGYFALLVSPKSDDAFLSERFVRCFSAGKHRFAVSLASFHCAERSFGIRHWH